MDTANLIASVAAVFAAASLLYSARAANAARTQTAIQRQLRIDAAQPYVWADLRPDDDEGGLLLFVLGNSGPTVATDVSVSFEPRLADALVHHRAEGVEETLQSGIASLPPGRVLTWSLGAVIDHVSNVDQRAARLTVTIQSVGPFGPVEPLTYQINLDDIRLSRRARPGSLRSIAEAITQAANASRTPPVDPSVRMIDTV